MRICQSSELRRGSRSRVAARMRSQAATTKLAKEADQTSSAACRSAPVVPMFDVPGSAGSWARMLAQPAPITTNSAAQHDARLARMREIVAGRLGAGKPATQAALRAERKRGGE